MSLQAQESVFRGFKALTVPRESVPVGAEWINGVGPNGSGVGQENVSVTRSLSEATFDRVFKQGLDLGILNYFQLTQNADSVSHIKYNDLTIHTVTDVTKVNLVSGQAILYEYLKAGKISITTTKGLGATLKAKLNQWVEGLTVDVSASGGETVTMSGDNLILAFRVFQIGKSKSKKDYARVKLQKDSPYPRPVDVLDYQVSINPQNFVNGIKSVGGTVNPGFSMEDWETCSKSYPFKVTLTNTAKIDMAGQVFRKTFELENGVVKRYSMTNRLSGGMVTDLVTVAFGYEFPRGGVMFLSEVLRESKVTVERITTPLAMMPSPRAPGW